MQVKKQQSIGRKQQQQKLLRQGQSEELTEGDTFWLVANLYPFRVHFQPTAPALGAEEAAEPKSKQQQLAGQKRKTLSSPSSSSSSSSSTATTTELHKKRKMDSSVKVTYEQKHNEEDQEEEEEEEQKAPLTKREGEDEKEEQEEGAFRIAIPSISTNTFQFDMEQAAEVACRVISDFLQKHKQEKRLRVVLVDFSPHSSCLQIFRKHYKEIGGDSRFTITHGDITRMKTGAAGIACRFIVNPTNKWFSGKGSGVNKAIHDAAGPCLLTETKRLHGDKPKLGVAYPVQLPQSSPLRQREGVHYCIHVLGPNMNPQRPFCLNGDYDKGRKYLADCYTSVLECFYQLCTSPSSLSSSSSSSVSPCPQEPKNAFGILMAKKKSAAPTAASHSALQTHKTAPSKGGGGGWSGLLADYILHPEQHSEAVVSHDDKTVVIKDKFPKAKYHFLVMPAQLVEGFSSLSVDDVPMLAALVERGHDLVKEIQAKEPSTEFRLGFHAVPSMRHLHMHVISQDFDSPCLKNKKHWHSFTSAFFIDAEDFVQRLVTEGRIQFEKERYEAMLKGGLACHRCSSPQKTIPALKAHIKTCSHYPKT
ncbi:aprataxin-like protein [Balamuthia mandrillaris]